MRLRAKRVGAAELAQCYLRRIAADETNCFVTVCEQQALAEARQADAEIAKERPARPLGRAHRAQGRFLHRWRTHYLRLEDARQLRSALRRHRGGAAQGRRRRNARQNQHGRVRNGVVQRNELLRRRRQPMGFGPRAGWLLRRFRRGGGRRPGRGRHRHRHRRLHPPAGGVLRHQRLETHLWPGVALRAGGVRLELGSRRADGASAADLRLLLRYMEGHDPRDSTSADVPATPEGAPETLRIGIPKEYWADLGADIAAPLESAATLLESRGHARQEISLPHTAFAVPAYYVIAGAEASTNLSRYDGVRYGHRAANPANLDDLYRRSRSEGFGAEVKRRILTGTYTLSVGYYDAYYKKAQRLRRLIRQDFLDAFQEVDAILAPATPTPAFERGRHREPTAMYQQDIFTIPASLAGLPALSVPCGFAGRLPIGMQLIGPHFAENRLLTLAEAFQRETDWHLRTPQGRERADEATLGVRDRPRGACAAQHALEDFLRRGRRLRRGRQHASVRRGPGAARRAARAERRSRAPGRAVRSRRARAHRQPLSLRPQELLLSGPA